MNIVTHRRRYFCIPNKTHVSVYKNEPQKKEAAQNKTTSSQTFSHLLKHLSPFPLIFTSKMVSNTTRKKEECG